MVSKLLTFKDKPHAILLVESKMCGLNEFINAYAKAIINDDKFNSKIDSNTFLDFIQLNGYETNIAKEDILKLINQFSKNAVELPQKQIYLIRGIEHASTQAINALLKFLEEPPKDVYAILTTRAQNLVLPTIRSRCQLYVLKSNIKMFEQKISQFNLTSTQANILKTVYYDIDDAIRDLNSRKFIEAYDFSYSFVKEYNDLVKIKWLQEKFIKFDYKFIKLVLKIINILINNNEQIIQLIDQISLNPARVLLFNKIWIILEGHR